MAVYICSTLWGQIRKLQLLWSITPSVAIKFVGAEYHEGNQTLRVVLHNVKLVEMLLVADIDIRMSWMR